MEEQCLPDAIYDLIIGNVPGARPADETDPTWQEACAVTTGSQATKDGEVTPLKVPSYQESPIVDKQKLKQMQSEDESLQKYWDRGDVLVKGQAEISFEVKSGILYRIYKHPFVNGGKPVKQMMVPVQLSTRIMEVAHGSIIRRHLSILILLKRRRVTRLRVHFIGQVFKVM